MTSRPVLIPASSGNDAPEVMRDVLVIAKNNIALGMRREERPASQEYRNYLEQSTSAEMLELKRREIENTNNMIRLESAHRQAAIKQDSEKLELIRTLIAADPRL